MTTHKIHNLKLTTEELAELVKALEQVAREGDFPMSLFIKIYCEYTHQVQEQYGRVHYEENPDILIDGK